MCISAIEKTSASLKSRVEFHVLIVFHCLFHYFSGDIIALVGVGRYHKLTITVCPSRPDDRDWVAQVLVEHWASTSIVTRGRVHQADRLPGLIALDDGAWVGLLTYRVEGDECEVVSLNSLSEGKGIGRALIAAVRAEAVDSGCSRLWLITTNDNLRALGFYQRLGFVISAIYPGAIAESRRLKPEMPEIGFDGIPIRDEIELSIDL